MLITRTPEIVQLAGDAEKDLVEMPLVACPRPPPPHLVRILLAELATPLTDRFIGQPDAARGHELFNIAITERELSG